MDEQTCSEKSAHVGFDDGINFVNMLHDRFNT